MKYLSTFFLIYALSSFVLKGTVDTITYKVDFGLKGNIVSFEERKYSTRVNKGNLANRKFVSSYKYKVIGDIVQPISAKENRAITNYSYNAVNRLIEARTKSLKTGSITAKTLYIYDNIDDLFPKLKLIYNSKGQAEDSVVIFYNHKKKEVTYTSYAPKNGKFLSKITYRYNKKGQIDKKVSETQASSFRYLYKFDKKYNKVIEEKWFSNNNLVQKIEYKYNKHGYLHKCTKFDSDEELCSEIEYMYDPISWLVLEVRQGKHIRKYEYNFDENDNWIVKYEFYDNLPMFITERKIKYKK